MEEQCLLSFSCFRVSIKSCLHIPDRRSFSSFFFAMRLVVDIKNILNMVCLILYVYDWGKLHDINIPIQQTFDGCGNMG